MDQSLGSYLNSLIEKYPQDMVRITDTVQPRFDITALTLELEKLSDPPALLFEKIAGHDMPVLTNLFASRRRLALAMAVEEADLPQELDRRLNSFISPVMAEDADFEIESYPGSDLNMLPIQTHLPEDGGPYITGGMLVARDPDTGRPTAGYHRLMYKGGNRLGVSLHSRRKLWDYFLRSEKLGRPLPCAIVTGVHPLIYLGSISFPPPQRDKFELMGGLFGEPLRLRQCKTIDLLVPAYSDILIEGEILNGVREDEGPFGEFTGYVSARSTRNVFVAKSIFIKEGAIYQDICPGLTRDHLLAASILREIAIKAQVQRVVREVKAVHVPRSGCGGFSCYISIKKTAEGQPKQALLAAMSVDHYLKTVIMVDDDIDVFDEAQVLWALNTRMRADRNIFVLPDAMGTLLDPSASDEALVAKLGIDATKPITRFAQTLSVASDQRAWAKKAMKKLGF